MTDPRLCLVTGATGFIGSRLVERLIDAGHTVRITCRPTSDLKWLAAVEGKFEKHTADLTDVDALAAAAAGCEWIFHLGGMTSAPDWKTFEAVNQEGTANVMKAAQQSAGDTLQRLVYISSIAAAGPAKRLREPRTEDMPDQPVSDYGRSKLGGERRLKEVADADTSRQWPWTVIRPPAVYGPRDKDVYEFFRMLRSGIRPSFGFPAMYTSVVHVEDLTSAMIAAAEAPAEQAVGEAFVACNPESYRFSDIMRQIQKAVGRRRALPIWLPMWVMFGYAAVAGTLGKWFGFKPPVSWDKARELACRYWVFSPAKAKQRLGWEATIDPEEGLQQTADWYRDKGWLNP